MSNTVHVIVPVYNVAFYLRRCLDSLLNQTYADYDIYLVNDASTDGSGEICREYADKYSKIHLIDKVQNEGVSAARNSALEQICGGGTLPLLTQMIM